MSWLGLTGQTAQVFQRLQNLRTVALKQLDRALLEVQNGIVLCWTEWMTSIVQVVDFCVLGKLDNWYGSVRAWFNWSFVMKAYDWAVNQQLSEDVRISTDVVSNGQLGGLQLCFVLIVLCTGGDLDRTAHAPRGRSTKAWRLLFQAYSPKNEARLVVLMMVVLGASIVVYGRRSGSHRKCSKRLEYEGVATSLSGVFPEERSKVGCADDGGTGSFDGHERCGGRSWRRDRCQRDCEGVTHRCFREFWKDQGLKVRVLVLREKVTANIRKSQDAEGPRHNRDLLGRRGFDEGPEFVKVDDVPGGQDRDGRRHERAT